MIELINQFVNRVSRQPHLKPILPTNVVRVCLQSGYKLHFIEISTEGCRTTTDSQARIDLWIKGDEEVMETIILGGEKLRKLEISNEVKISGKLRDILMLESLFYLTERRLSA